MDKSDLPFQTIVTLSSLIKSREVSPVDLTAAFLERISTVDSKINSYITVCADRAMASAKASEQLLANNNYLGPLHGIPYAIKDQFWSKGIQTTAGSNLLKNFVPTENSTVIEKMNSAGTILLGKLNLSEFATGNSIVHPWGTPRNPWDLDRNPGTSSSGSGAATASFLCAGSIGEDTGGSIRGPANNCNLVGLRPTYGLVSRYGIVGASWSNDIAGPIAHSAADAALILQAIAGQDPKDPYTSRRPPPDYFGQLRINPSGLTIGVIKEAMYASFVTDEVKEITKQTLSKFIDLGFSVTEVSIPLLEYTAVLNRIFIEVEAGHMHRRGLENHFHDYDHNVRTDFLTGLVLPAQLYYKAQRIRELIRVQVRRALDKVDVLALPGSSDIPPLIDHHVGINSKQHAIDRMTGRRSLNGTFNLASVPALTFPSGFITSTGKKLPVGFQIAGKPFSDGLLLSIAHAYQEVTNWHKEKPPI